MVDPRRNRSRSARSERDRDTSRRSSRENYVRDTFRRPSCEDSTRSDHGERNDRDGNWNRVCVLLCWSVLVFFVMLPRLVEIILLH